VNPGVRVTRVLRAPAADVFDAWTDASRLRQWLNPGPGVLAEASADPVVGGEFRLVRLTSSGVEEVTGQYLVVDPPRRLVFTWQSPDSTGGAMTQVTVNLRSLGDGDTTEMTILHERLPAARYQEGARRAWTAIAARLDGYLVPATRPADWEE
jgi:uncharacterized protein YndB with AHSA1/START domain